MNMMRTRIRSLSMLATLAFSTGAIHATQQCTLHTQPATDVQKNLNTVEKNIRDAEINRLRSVLSKDINLIINTIEDPAQAFFYLNSTKWTAPGATGSPRAQIQNYLDKAGGSQDAKNSLASITQKVQQKYGFKIMYLHSRTRNYALFVTPETSGNTLKNKALQAIRGFNIYIKNLNPNLVPDAVTTLMKNTQDVDKWAGTLWATLLFKKNDINAQQFSEALALVNQQLGAAVPALKPKKNGLPRKKTMHSKKEFAPEEKAPVAPPAQKTNQEIFDEGSKLQWIPLRDAVRLSLALESAREETDPNIKYKFLGRAYALGLKNPNLLTPAEAEEINAMIDAAGIKAKSLAAPATP